MVESLIITLRPAFDEFDLSKQNPAPDSTHGKTQQVSSVPQLDQFVDSLALHNLYLPPLAPRTVSAFDLPP
jgi:hypothetical protein